jgi:hypothetical protein
VGHFRLRVEALPLFERVPQALIAHDDCIDYAKTVECELVLPEHADLVGTDDRALLGRELARQQLHERGLASAIRAGQAIAPALRERRRHVVEEHLRPVTHGNAVN